MIWHKFNEQSPPPYKDVAFYYYGAVFTGAWLPRWKSFDMHEPTACAPVDNPNPYTRISMSDFDLGAMEWCDIDELKPIKKD